MPIGSAASRTKLPIQGAVSAAHRGVAKPCPATHGVAEKQGLVGSPGVYLVLTGAVIWLRLGTPLPKVGASLVHVAARAIDVAHGLVRDDAVPGIERD